MNQKKNLKGRGQSAYEAQMQRVKSRDAWAPLARRINDLFPPAAPGDFALGKLHWRSPAAGTGGAPERQAQSESQHMLTALRPGSI